MNPIQPNEPPTLDGLFRRILARQPSALALVDPLDKFRINMQAPKRLTFAQADRAISALAAHFIDAGLTANSVIAVQLPNTIEFMLTVLGAHRAGLVVALLPQLWRQAELTAALSRTGARAIVGMSRIDGVNHADLVMHAAAEAFSVRHVCGFGDNLPEGMASLDEVIAGAAKTSAFPAHDAGRPAIISFDVTVDGFQAIPRTHQNLIAGGLAIFLESGVPQGARILSAFAPSSFAGLASSLVTWLLSGGMLALHHPFDTAIFEQQINDQRCDTLVAPARMALRLCETAMLLRLPSLRNVIGLWRSPEQVSSSAPWAGGQATLTDVYLFGEAGLFGVKRLESGVPMPILPGPHGAPRHVADSTIVGETLLTAKGMLALRGPMVAAEAYALHSSSASTPVDQAPLDHVNTGYFARLDPATGGIMITAPPPGLMTVGGYRFLLQDLQEWARRLGQGALLTGLPDRLSGYRLAGRAQDNARAREALTQLGLNPLMVEAFRDRSPAATT